MLWQRRECNNFRKILARLLMTQLCFTITTITVLSKQLIDELYAQVKALFALPIV